MRCTIGIDEVGRGALAGPVMVAAVLTTGRWWLTAGRPEGKLRDSKKLSPRRREEWFEYFKNHPKIGFCLARVYPRQIEKKNISRAANLAAERAFDKLTKSSNLKAKSCGILLDGGLYLGNGDQLKNVKTIIRGDQKIPAVKIASIIAKVTRDRSMVRLSKKYPQYGFEVHKGYGTSRHLQAIRRHGPSEAHRLTFLKKFNKIRT